MPKYDSISVKEYVSALKKPLPEKYREILFVQYQCPHHKASSHQLARLIGSRGLANRPYGRLAHQVCDALHIAKPPGYWFKVLSTADYNGKTWIWTMRPNLVKAIKQLGWSRDNLTPERKSPKSAGVKTYLFTCNLNHPGWDIEDAANETAAGKAITADIWSCGVRRYFDKGGRVFFVKLGNEPRGILGAGKILASESYYERHHDETKAVRGEKSAYIKGQWQRILNPDVDKLLPL